MLTKSCHICGQVLPATTEFFSPSSTGLYKLHPHCKKCRNAALKKHRVDLTVPKPAVQKGERLYQDFRDECAAAGAGPEMIHVRFNKTRRDANYPLGRYVVCAAFHKGALQLYWDRNALTFVSKPMNED